jgi:hypothetical protein
VSKSEQDRRSRSEARSGKKKAGRSNQAGRVNKTLEIRKVARRLVDQGKPPRPAEILAILELQGITVQSAQISTALKGTELAYRRNRENWERPRSPFPEPALALQLVGLEDVQKAKAFVEDLGSLEKAMAALVALGQFGGEGNKASGQGDAPFVSDCRWPEQEKAEKPTS